MNRFLRYSQEKGRKIRMMLMLNGQLAQKTALVRRYDEQAAVLQLGQRKQPVTVPLSDILGCDYAPGRFGRGMTRPLAAFPKRQKEGETMFHKIKDYLEKHPKQYELLRYLIAGGLTTVLSMVISYGMEFLLAARPERTAGFLQWVIDCINAATARQVMIANAVSWVIAVLFAFWINRKMVFQVKGGTGASVLRELGEFALGRVLSFALFEEGMAYLLKLIGVSNVVNRIIVLVVVMIFNYVVSKFWVFKEKEAV